MSLPFLTLLCHQPVANLISLQIARRISVLFGVQPGKPPAAAQNQFFNVYQICERGTCCWWRVLGNLSQETSYPWRLTHQSLVAMGCGEKKREKGNKTQTSQNELMIDDDILI